MTKAFSTEYLTSIFAKEDNDYEGFRNVMFDLVEGNEMFDDEGNKVTEASANKTIRKVVFEILGINENSTKRDRKRAMKKHGQELFEVIEEVIDLEVSKGFNDSEFFNEFVETKNIALGDRNEFWTDDDVILSVAQISGDHHDLTIQRLGSGSSYAVTMGTYGIKVGTDIDLYLTGRIDWAKLINACARAFVVKVQTDIFAEFMNAGDQIPVNAMFQKTLALNATNKEVFDQLIEDVSTANDNKEVYIIGTKMALKKLNALTDVDWRANSQKEDVANSGRLGSYEGTTLIEIPQRFAQNFETAAEDKKRLVSNDKLMIFAKGVDYKPVKFVDQGETEITEQGQERGDRFDDTMTYEMQRSLGIATQIGKYFGVWNISE